MSEPGEIEIRPVVAHEVRPLRREVLRPGQSKAQLLFSADDDASTLHLAAFGRGRILAVSSVMREGMPGDPRPGDWRIRGMASTPAVRGRGIGSAMLERCVEHAREHGGTRVWCNARVGARSLYERAGMDVHGERFELPGIGDHFLMAMAIESAGR